MRKFLMLFTSLLLVFFIYSCTGTGEVSVTFIENGGTEVEDITVNSSSTSINFPEPTKEGFTFDGWYLDEDLTEPFTIAALLTNTTLTLYAKWASSVLTYTITFEPNGGSAVAAITGEAGSTVTAPSSPTKTGNTFGGWYSDALLTTPYIFTTMPESNITLYAKWNVTVADTKTITFESNGGSVVSAITLEVGLSVTAPTAPTKVGNTFGGWHSDALLTTPYTFTTMPAENITLYAKWTVNNYTISFEENGGTDVTNITQAYLSTVTAPTAPTKLGNTFGGWYSDALLTTPYTFTTMPAENITLYAKWTVNNYTISFEENGGTDVTNITQAYLSVVTAPAQPTRIGYTFDGWYSDELLATPYTFNTMPANDFVLYAKWVPTQYTIVFNENGGTDVVDITQAYLSVVTAPTAPTKLGHTFAGWHSDALLTTPYTFTTMPHLGLELFAKWTINTYTITFEENGGTEVLDITQDYMTTVTQPSNPTKEGFDFVTWYSNAELTTAYTFTTMPAENITLYAKWVYKEYAIHYVDGTNVIAPTMIKAFDPIVLMADPVRPGYLFDGWFNEELFINPFTLTIMPEEDITVYAKWSPAVFTLSYETNGGLVVTEKLIPYNQEIPEHEIPVKEGFVFVGWYADVALTTLFTETIMPLGDITLYAKWVVDDGYDMISTILAQNPETVKVKGVIYYKFPNPMDPGFYLYDGTGFIFVLHPSTGLEVGDGIELEGNFNYFEYVPQITNVFNLVANNTFTTLPEDIVMSLGELAESSPENPNLFGQPIAITGIVQKDNGRFFLVQAGSEYGVAINYKSVDPMNNPFESRVGSMITMYAIIHGVDPMMEIWHVLYNPATLIEDIVLTDQQKVDELIQFGINQLNGKEFYSSQILELPTIEPVYGAILEFETIGDNATYLDVLTGVFLETEVQKNITIRITVTIGTITETVDVTIILLPTDVLSIAEFMLLDEMDYAHVTGIVIFSFGDFGLLIIADENGDILPIQSDEMAIFGQRVIVHGYFANMEGLAMMGGADDTVLEVLEEDVPNPLVPTTITIDQFNALDVFNSLYWAKYFNISGELVFDEMTHSFQLVDGLSSMPIIVFDQEIYETLIQFEGFEVTLGGFSLPNFDEDPFLMFIFTGQVGDITLDYTDQELADMLALMLQGYLESETYIPGQIADLPTEHPIFDLSVSYAVALEDAAFIDLLTMTIDPAIEIELWISLIATITIGEASADVDIELHVKPIEILTIEEFMLLVDQDMHYVKGVILMIVSDQSMIMIADETGALLSMSTNPMIQVGDLVLLHGAKMETPDGMIILANDPGSTVESILLSNQDNPLIPTPISIEAFSMLDINDPLNYLNYYQVEGLLLKDMTENVFAVSDGMSQLPVFTPTPNAVNQLIPFEGQQVKLSGFSLGIEDGGGNMILVFIGYPGDVMTRYTDEELAIHIATSLSDDYLNKILRPGATHKLPNGYPPFEASISYEVIGPNAPLYDLTTGLISDTIILEAFIGIRATITVGIEVEIVEFDLWIQPIETQTVAEFLAGAFDELYVIRAVVVMEQMMDGPMIIADATGHMFVVKQLGVKIGDEVIIQGYKRSQEGIALMWDEETTILVEVVSEDIANPMTLNIHTIVSFNDIDMANMDNWGIYVEITGYMSLLEDSYFPVLTEFIDGGEFAAIAPMYLHNEGPSTLMMENPMESIYQYIGYEVRVRGFLLPNFGEEDPLAPDRMMIVTNPGELEITYQTNQEKIDALIVYGEYMLSQEIFRPGDYINLPDYIDVLGISITWEFVGTNGYAVDLVNMTFLDVIATELIDFEATMTIGELTATHIFVFTLAPYPIITINDFYNIEQGEYAKLEVIVSKIIDYGEIVFQESGSDLYLIGYGFDGLNVGDEVILFGMNDQYSGFVKISGYSDQAYYTVMNTNMDEPLIERTVTIQQFANASTESINLVYYNKVQGHLVFDNNYGSYYLTDGLNTINITFLDYDFYAILDSYVGMDVEIKVFNYEYVYTAFGQVWSGLLIEGIDVITSVTYTDEQKTEIMMAYIKNEMNRSFKDDMTYAFSATHPIYGGSYQFVIAIEHADRALVNGNEITFASTLETIHATVNITATSNGLDLVSFYDLIIVPYDDLMSLNNPGSLGLIPELEDTTELGTFGGLIVTKVDRESDWFGGSNMVVELEFPYPSEVGVSYYTLQYYDSSLLMWTDFMMDGYPLTTTWDNFSLVLSEGMTFRLLADNGSISNAVTFEVTYIDTYFAGWTLDISMFITGTMEPFVGHGLLLEEIYIYNLNGDSIESGYSLQWYRVNPYTYEEILIVGATNPLYVTTTDDLGYYLMVKVSGDEINVGGMIKIYNMETVKIKNYGYVTNETTMGFSIGFDYIVDIDDLSDLTIYSSTGQLIFIDSITATSNPAVFNIELDLIGVDSIYINLEQITYIVCQYNEYYDQIGINVELI